MEVITQCEAVLANQQFLYSLLAGLYRNEVSQSSWDELSKLAFPRECPVPVLSEGYRQLEAYFKRPGRDPITDLAVDYARVFLGAGIAEGTAAYPYASVYTSAERLMMQEARDRALAMYTERQLARSAEFDVPEDHLSLELEFACRLAEDAKLALSRGDLAAAVTALQAQENFLTQEVLPWLPRFCEDVERYSQTQFYKAVAKITGACVALHAGVLQDMIADLGTVAA